MYLYIYIIYVYVFYIDKNITTAKLTPNNSLNVK